MRKRRSTTRRSYGFQRSRFKSTRRKTRVRKIPKYGSSRGGIRM